MLMILERLLSRSKLTGASEAVKDLGQLEGRSAGRRKGALERVQPDDSAARS